WNTIWAITVVVAVDHFESRLPASPTAIGAVMAIEKPRSSSGITSGAPCIIECAAWWPPAANMTAKTATAQPRSSRATPETRLLNTALSDVMYSPDLARHRRSTVQKMNQLY